MTGEEIRSKGKLFEKQVARFLEKQGWKPTLGRPFRGRIAVRPHDCDIFAKRTRPGFVLVTMFCLLLVGVAVAYWFGWLPAEFEVQELGWVFDSLALIGFLGGPLVAKRSTQYVWVECKNLQQSIKRDLIMKLKDQFRDATKMRGVWECWLVSTSRFDEDAIAHAKAHGVRCYQAVAAGGRSMALHEIKSTTGDV